GAQLDTLASVRIASTLAIARTAHALEQAAAWCGLQADGCGPVLVAAFVGALHAAVAAAGAAGEPTRAGVAAVVAGDAAVVGATDGLRVRAARHSVRIVASRAHAVDALLLVRIRGAVGGGHALHAPAVLA